MVGDLGKEIGHERHPNKRDGIHRGLNGFGNRKRARGTRREEGNS